jgi:PEGA domain
MVKSLVLDRRLAACLAIAGAALCTGCVERRYTLRTEPPGALAIVNGEEVGQTPVSRSFYYYGDREITFILDGYETKTLIQPVKAPWWDNLFFEFFTENLVPFNLRDEREFKYQLTPASSPRASDLRDRAEQLRSEAQVLPKPRRGGLLGWLGFID